MNSFFKRFFAAFTSGARAAYAGLFVLGVGPFSRMLDSIAAGFIKKDVILKEVPPCIVIVGTARSGATLVYQVLTREISSAFLTNLHTLMPQTASWILRQYPPLKERHFRYKNYYGYTAQIGDVNEGNDIFRYLLEPGITKEEVRRRFLTLCSRLGGGPSKPVILKNVRHYDRIGVLAEAVPEISFVHVKRSLLFNAQSVYKAYLELGYFHPVPEQFKNLHSYDPIELSVHQVLAVNQKLESQLSSLGNDRYETVGYGEFCQDFDTLIQHYSKKLGMSESSTVPSEIYSLKESRRQSVSDSDFTRIKEFVKKIEDGN